MYCTSKIIRDVIIFTFLKKISPDTVGVAAYSYLFLLLTKYLS
jgi:hypothetical protein